jgi:Protein of unknown function (DUF1553)/Protein of unknown function (DUF1549)
MARGEIRITIVAAVCLGSLAAPALARPAYKKALADRLGQRLARKLDDCRTCHVPAGRAAEGDEPRPHNPFGKRLDALRSQLQKAGKRAGIRARIDAVADEDSDGDGVSNVLELITGHFPGEADDRPSGLELTRGRNALAALREARRGDPWNPFQPVTRPEMPAIRSDGWVRNPVDAFIAAEHEAHGLTHRPEASRPVLLRRLYLDLIGLPPAPDELHAFLSDESADAYEKIVERLLSSPRYGERWGRHWMDVWRYSDWAGWGKQVRDSQPHIWHWRDWIIESLNQNKPYDRMVTEMLAADEACPDDRSALRATGYLARNFKLLSREKWMQDVVDHTAQAFLGITLGCARCHNHMYDPILQREYYQVRAIFEPHQVRIDRVAGVLETTTDGLPRAFDAQLAASTFLFDRGDDRAPTGSPLSPGVPEALGGRFVVTPVSLPPSARAPDRRPEVIRDQLAVGQSKVIAARQKLASIMQGPNDGRKIELARLELELAEADLAAQVSVERAEGLVEQGHQGSREWTAAAKAANAAQRKLAVAGARQREAVARQARHEAAPKQRAEADRAHARALEALAAAEQAAHRLPETSYTRPVVTTYPATSTGRRLALARWMVDPSNPLTARVAVNHLWGRHFGRAIVPTVHDFGRNGQRPSHPALLDWLAAELVARGWDMKAVHRLIVTSAVYRQDSAPETGNLARDPDNVFLWRWTPRRAEAEVVRDCLFAAGCSLDSTMGGPDIDQNLGLSVPRRSVYFQHAAEKQMEFLQIFDAPSVTECYRRKESILPQQALALANSELSMRMARRLARAIAVQSGADPSRFVTAAFEHVLGRLPTPVEQNECRAYLAHPGHLPSSSQAIVESAFVEDRAGKSPAHDPALRRRESLVHVLLNHHEFVTIR